MKTIPLTKGQVALVDDEFYERLVALGPWRHYKLKWKKKGYAVRNVRRNVLAFMHHDVMRLSAASGTGEIDHRNENGCDNRRSNLRWATTSQNQCNRGPQVNNRCGYKGVAWHKHKGRWRATIKLNRQNRHLGYFATPEDAAAAYDLAARELHGEFCYQNFPAKA